MLLHGSSIYKREKSKGWKRELAVNMQLLWNRTTTFLISYKVKHIEKKNKPPVVMIFLKSCPNTETSKVNANSGIATLRRKNICQHIISGKNLPLQ